MAKGKKFRGPDIVKQIDESLDKGLRRFLINSQSKLSASSPRLTGRLASSWYIGKAIPNRTVPPEMEIGSTPVITPYVGDIKMDTDWYISSNLPYTARAAYDPGYVGYRGGGAGDWFTRIENKLADDAVRAFDYFLRKVK